MIPLHQIISLFDSVEIKSTLRGVFQCCRLFYFLKKHTCIEDAFAVSFIEQKVLKVPLFNIQVNLL